MIMMIYLRVVIIFTVMGYSWTIIIIIIIIIVVIIVVIVDAVLKCCMHDCTLMQRGFE